MKPPAPPPAGAASASDAARASLASLYAALGAAEQAAGAFDGAALTRAVEQLRLAATGLQAAPLAADEMVALRERVSHFGRSCGFLGNVLQAALMQAGATGVGGYSDPVHPAAEHSRPLVERYG